jgi:hypothetical protein
MCVFQGTVIRESLCCNIRLERNRGVARDRGHFEATELQAESAAVKNVIAVLLWAISVPNIA